MATREQVLNEILDEIRDEILTCVVIRQEDFLRPSCNQCDSYVICKRILEED